MKNFIVITIFSISFASCMSGPTDAPHYECRSDYYHWTQVPTGCQWYYSIESTDFNELDLASDISEINEEEVELTADYYARTYALSYESAHKLSKSIFEFKYLKDRSANDLADFAEKLYGINAFELIEAISSAQIGNNEKLNHVINEAAENFNTSKENMKNLVKDLHQHALESNGIVL